MARRLRLRTERRIRALEESARDWGHRLPRRHSNLSDDEVVQVIEALLELEDGPGAGLLGDEVWANLVAMGEKPKEAGRGSR